MSKHLIVTCLDKTDGISSIGFVNSKLVYVFELSKNLTNQQDVFALGYQQVVTMFSFYLGATRLLLIT
jgi:hypothetical protein